MRQDTIYKSNGTAQANITIGRGHTNGVIINTDSEDWKITAKLRNSEGTEVTIPNMELKRFGVITDFLYGAGGQEMSRLVNLVQGLVAASTDKVALEASADYIFLKSVENSASGYNYRVDMGSVYLNDGDELIIDLSNAAAKKLHVTSFSESRRPFELITYEQVQDTNSSYHGVQSIFCLGGSENDLYATDLSFKVTDAYGTFITDQVGVFATTRLMGRFETLSTPNFGLVYVNPTQIPESVSVQITGNDAKNAVLYVVRKVLIQKAVSQNTLIEAKKTISRVRELEIKNPSQAKALRHAGAIGKSWEMQQHLEAVEQAN